MQGSNTVPRDLTPSFPVSIQNPTSWIDPYQPSPRLSPIVLDFERRHPNASVDELYNMTGRYLAARPPPKNPLTLDTPQPQFPTTTRLEVRRNAAQTQQIAMSSSFATSLGDVSGNQQLHQHQPAWSPSSGFPADELQPAYFDPSRPSGITLTSPTAPTTPGQYNLSINTAEHPSPASGRNPPQRPTPGPPDDYDIGYQALHRPPISEPSLTEEHISGWRYGVPSPSMANFPSLARPHAENEPSSSSAYRPPPSSTTTRPHTLKTHR